jgi:hypothetical protein
MKRHIVAIALAVLTAPAVAQETGAPYDQSLVDRQLPNIDFAPVEPNLPAARTQVAETAGAGGTRSDVEISTGQAVNLTSGSGLATGPWANDYHFIAPAQ